MRRREFILLVGSAAAAWPLAAHTQQPGKVHRIGYLGTSSPSLERHFTEAFRQKLRELGHVEGQTVVIEYRWAEGQDDRLSTLVAELVQLQPDVIVTTGTPSTVAAKQATATIPIVFASSADPIIAGLVESFARPGGNVTGFTISGPELEGKRVQLFKDAFPALSRAAVLWNSTNPAGKHFIPLAEKAAAAWGVTLQPILGINRIDDFKDAFSAIVAAKPDGIIVFPGRIMLAHRMEIINFASTNRLPAIYAYRGYVDAGGLMSYAPSDLDQFRRTATYVDRILKGAKPGELPVQEPTRFELVINLTTAKTLGLNISPALLANADELIE